MNKSLNVVDSGRRQLEPVPVIQTTIRYKRIVDIPQGPSFPRSIFDYRRYNSWRVLALILLAMTALSFGYAVLDPMINPGKYKDAAITYRDGRGLFKVGFEWLYETFWQAKPVTQKTEEEAYSLVYWQRLYAGAYLAAAWLFVWICFDWKNAHRLIYGLALLLFGIVYALMPVDMFPDFVPVVGLLDDVLVSVFGVGLGISAIVDHGRRQKQTDHIKEIIKEHPASGLRLLLKEHGLAVEEVEEKTERL
jgi:uncharacterized membrane protein YkvA (DUF1232 family)